MAKRKKHSGRYRLKVRPRSRPIRVALFGSIGVGLGYLFGGGGIAPSIGWSIFYASFMVGLMELYASTHALVLGEHGLTIVGPVTVRGPKADIEIPYAALVEVEEHGKKLKLGYHVDPLLMGDPPTHHVSIEPEDKVALLHALTARMQRAQRHHVIERARSRYRVALSYLATLGVAAGGAALLGVLRR